MKKTYIIPSLVIEEVVNTEILAGSPEATQTFSDTEAPTEEGGIINMESKLGVDFDFDDFNFGMQN